MRPLKKKTLLSATSPTRPPLRPVWSINDVRMWQCVSMNSEWTQNVQKYIRVYQITLKSIRNYFFLNISLGWIFTTLSWKPIVSIVLWPNHSGFFFGVEFWIFLGCLEFFVSTDLVFGFGYWTLSDRLFKLWF